METSVSHLKLASLSHCQAALAFSPTDPDLLVATTKLSDKNAVILWNIKSELSLPYDTHCADPILPVATFDLPANSLRIAFHPSGTQFAVVCEHGSRDQALFFWYGPYGMYRYFQHLTPGADKASAWALREDIHMGCTGIDLGVSLDEVRALLQ
jgi:WD40 repeat protein